MGKENVGKTTLIKRIIGDWGIGNKMKSFIWNEDTRIPTDGIEMKQWKPKEIENTIVYFWDFAGQELYYSTHHFFLTENSINLIVFDCTKSLLENRLLFWLNSIQSMAPESHIILIGTFAEKKNNKEEIEKISNEINELIKSWEFPWGLRTILSNPFHLQN